MDELITFTFLGFKLNCFSYPQISHSYFADMEISMSCFSQFVATLCVWVNLINLPKQQNIERLDCMLLSCHLRVSE